MAQRWKEKLVVFVKVSELSVVPSAGQRPVLDIVGAQLRRQQTWQVWMQRNPLRFAWGCE